MRMTVFFFFSSRRRHTRLQGDWSSDVCSSDLPVPLRTVTVNCNNGQRVQPAVDANAGPVEIDITGICVENVVIRDKDVMLKGATKPSLDGIRSAVRSTPALTIRGSGIDSLDSLSFSITSLSRM